MRKRTPEEWIRIAERLAEENTEFLESPKKSKNIQKPTRFELLDFDN